ncbi:MAG: peptidylprolyl isomerase [Bacteroidetes bacterium]|nr:peptidylprolyl isomerase [Bacteroidota bacterium]
MNLRLSSRSARLCALVVLCSAPAIAQPVAPAGPGGNRELIDGVAAVVGNDVILVSDVLQQAALYARQNRSGDPKDPKLQRDVLNALIDEKLVLTRAKEDSIVVTDEELNRAVDYQVQRILSQFGGSAENAEKAYGMSMDRIRQESREILRQQFLVERVRQKRFADLKPSEADIQQFYRTYKDSLPQVPEQVELQSIVMLAKPSAEAKSATLALAHSIIDSLKAGGDFASFARRYSGDPGSAQNGGDLGFVEKGKFVPEFENAVKHLGVNDISDPVESPYGIHIIQLLDRKGESTHTRHILLRIQQSGSERDSLLARLKDLKRRALAGEDFAQLATKYSEDEETKELGGSLGKLPLDQIPADTKGKIADLKDGDITDPIPAAVSATQSGYQIIRIAHRIAPHPLDPEQDRAQLERLAALYKQNQEYTKWVADLRTEIYWEIKTTF